LPSPYTLQNSHEDIEQFWKQLLLPKQPEILQNQGSTSLEFKEEIAASATILRLQKQNWKSRLHTGKHSGCSTRASEQRGGLQTQHRAETRVHKQSSNHSLSTSE